MYNVSTQGVDEHMINAYYYKEPVHPPCSLENVLQTHFLCVFFVKYYGH